MSVYWQTDRVTLLQGDVREQLRTLLPESVQAVVTSPPYWGLRAYGTAPQVWGGDPDHEHAWTEQFTPNQNAGGGVTAKQATNRGSFAADCYHGDDAHDFAPAGKRNRNHLGASAQAARPKYSSEDYREGGPLPRKADGPRGRTSAFCACGAWRGELGSEPSVGLFVSNLVEVFAEVWRVLRPDGTLWLNLGDSFNGSGGAGGDYRAGGLREGEPTWGAKRSAGLKPKDLCGVPWRVALALQEWGWWLRSDIVWGKSNPMPESVTDRPTRAHEYVFLLTKRERYFYDADAVREITGREMSQEEYGRSPAPGATWQSGGITKYAGANKHDGGQSHPLGRNSRSIWLLSSEPYAGCHFATFPTELPRRCVLAGTSEAGCCPVCGAAWQRVVERTPMVVRRSDWGEQAGSRIAPSGTMIQAPSSRRVGWQPSCSCPPAPATPCTVLDPFNGSGTTGLVALQLGRNYVGIDLNPDYLALARRRLEPAALQEILPLTSTVAEGHCQTQPTLFPPQEPEPEGEREETAA